MEIILFKSLTPGFNVHFESIPKITRAQKPRSRGHFSIRAGEQKLYKEMKWTEVACEAQGLYFAQTLPERLAEQC